MTQPRPETIERERDKLYISDAELFRWLGVPRAYYSQPHSVIYRYHTRNVRAPTRHAHARAPPLPAVIRSKLLVKDLPIAAVAHVVALIKALAAIAHARRRHDDPHRT